MGVSGVYPGAGVGQGSGGELGQLEDGRLDRGLLVVAVDLVHVGVGVADDHHAHFLRHLLALEHGDHGMAEAMEALLGELVLTLGVARIDTGATHDFDELLAALQSVRI